MAKSSSARRAANAADTSAPNARPSGIRNQQPKTSVASIATKVGLPEDTTIQQLLSLINKIGPMEAERTPENILKHLQQRSPEDLRAMLGGAAGSAPSAAKAAGQAGDARKALIEAGQDPNWVSSLSEQDAQKAVETLRARQAQGAQAQVSQQKRQEKLAKTKAANEKAATQDKGGQKRRGGGRRKAEAVTTANEELVTNVSNDTVSGGAADLESMPSDKLYEAARNAQIREGMTPGGLVSNRLESSQSIKLPEVDAAGTAAMGDSITVNAGGGMPAPAPKANPADPFPDLAEALPMDAPVATPGPAEPMKMPSSIANSKTAQTVGKVGRHLGKNWFDYLVAGGAGYGAVEGIRALRGSGSQQQDSQTIDEAVREAVLANERLRQRFGGYGQSTGIMIPADKPATPEDTIRQSQRAR